MRGEKKENRWQTVLSTRHCFLMDRHGMLPGRHACSALGNVMEQTMEGIMERTFAGLLPFYFLLVKGDSLADWLPYICPGLFIQWLFRSSGWQDLTPHNVDFLVSPEVMDKPKAQQDERPDIPGQSDLWSDYRGLSRVNHLYNKSRQSKCLGIWERSTLGESKETHNMCQIQFI